jgi:hypothetical protein
MLVTDTTTWSVGGTFLETTVCSAETIAEAAAITSRV